MQTLSWPALDPWSIPQASANIDGTHAIINLNFEKYILIFHKWWWWLFSAVNVLIQCFFYTPRPRSTPRIKECSMYLFLRPINQSSSLMKQNPYQNVTKSWLHGNILKNIILSFQKKKSYFPSIRNLLLL